MKEGKYLSSGIIIHADEEKNRYEVVLDEPGKLADINDFSSDNRVTVFANRLNINKEKKQVLRYSEIESEIFHFNNSYQLGKDKKYTGDAEVVILIWNKYKIMMAEKYCKANYSDKKVDIVVCENPNIQKKQIGDKAIIVNF